MLAILSTSIMSAQHKDVYPGADEKSPSKAQYSSWLNNTNEGATEAQTLVNLDFFRWLHDTYGMQLEIYAFDAGLIDGKRFYGSMDSERFRSKFPTGFGNVYDKAKEMGTRLGIWGGPDGFGDTRESAEARKEMMVSLCRDYDFGLFKMDGVCGPLRLDEGKDEDLADMLRQCRIYSPDLILLNHRLNLGKAMPHATTYLWDGRETYVDVFTQNTMTAPHNRAGTLAIGLTPGLERLVEDCGVCLSSCLNGWDDEMILQAFSRSLILAPEMYGNPWLLSDREFPKLARIYNLHRKYADILVDGMQLAQEKYGDYAVSRGDRRTRLLTLRNLSWEPRTFTVSLSGEIGLTDKGRIHVRSYHPTERIIGDFRYGDNVEVTVPPFRTMLLLASSAAMTSGDLGLEGADYEVIRDVAGSAAEIRIKGLPGTSSEIRLPSYVKASRVLLDGIDVTREIRKGMEIDFDGDPLTLPFHRHIGTPQRTDVASADTKSLYEATVFSADNNALEVRSMQRSGDTEIQEVNAARSAFFGQDAFIRRGVWDRYLFDGDMGTGFWPSSRYGWNQRVRGGCFRLDLGKEYHVDSLVVRVKDEYAMEPFLIAEGNYAMVSSDLREWKSVLFVSGLDMVIPVNGKMRYMKMNPFPDAIAEVEAYAEGKKIESRAFRASNLFADGDYMDCKALWRHTFTLNESAAGSYLSVALNGEHGVEGAYVAATVDGRLTGAPSRATSYQSNTWEYVNGRSSSNYTYYIPLTDDMKGKQIEVFVMGYDSERLDFKPEIWISSRNPYSEKVLIIER